MKNNRVNIAFVAILIELLTITMSDNTVSLCFHVYPLELCY